MDIVMIDPKLIDRMKHNPIHPLGSTFKNVNGWTMKSLEEDIKEKGMLTPLKVIDMRNGRYRLTNGHHRLAIALHLKMKEVPCIIECRL
jgi:ParB-like chromosome segregation protein Spo0J